MADKDDTLPGLGPEDDIPLPRLGVTDGPGAPPASGPQIGGQGDAVGNAGAMTAISHNLDQVARQLAALSNAVQQVSHDTAAAVRAFGESHRSRDARVMEMVQVFEQMKGYLDPAAAHAPVIAAENVEKTRKAIADLVRLLGERANELMVGQMAPSSAPRRGALLVSLAGYLVVALLGGVGGTVLWEMNGRDQATVSNPFIDAGNNTRWLTDCPKERRVGGNRCAMNMAQQGSGTR